MFNSSVPLWPGEESNNNFAYYLVGGIGLIYFVTLLITCCTRRTRSGIIVVHPVEECTHEAILHKYLLIIDTSIFHGSSCSTNAMVYIQIVGDKKECKYHKINVFSYGRFLFQSGCRDILLFKVRGDLGDIKKVKIVVTGTEKLTWKIRKLEVVKLATDDRWVVPYAIIHTDELESNPKGVLHQSQRRYSLLTMILIFHQWTSSCLVPMRYGAYTTFVNVLLVFSTLTVLLVGTLIAYIITPEDEYTDIVHLDWINVLYASVMSIIVGVFCGFLKIILYETKCGSLKRIRKFQSSLTEEKCDKTAEKSSSKYCHLFKDVNLIPSSGNIGSPTSGNLEKFHSVMRDSFFAKLDDNIDLDDNIELDENIELQTFKQNLQSNKSVSADNFFSVSEFRSAYNFDSQSNFDVGVSREVTQETAQTKNNDTSRKKYEVSADRYQDQDDDRRESVPEMFIRSEDIAEDSARIEYSLIEKKQHEGISPDVNTITSSEQAQVFDVEEDLLSLPVQTSELSHDISRHVDDQSNDANDSIGPSNSLAYRAKRDDTLVNYRIPFSQRKQLKILETSRKFSVESFTFHFIQRIQNLIIKTKTSILNEKFEDFQNSLNENVTSLCCKMEEQLFTQLGHLHNIQRLVKGDRMLSVLEVPFNLMSIAVTMTKKTIEEVAKKMGQQSSMTQADFQELCYGIFIKIANFNGHDFEEGAPTDAGDVVKSQPGTRGDAELPAENITENIREALDGSDNENEIDERLSVKIDDNSREINSVIATVIKKGLGLAFHSTFGETISIDEETLLDVQSNGSLQLAFSNLFHGKTSEITATREFCRQLIQEAQEELMTEYTDPINVYVQFLLRQVTLKQLKNLCCRSEVHENLKSTVDALQRKWHKEGFRRTLHAESNLAKVLLTGYIKNLKGTDNSKKDSMYQPLQSITLLKRIEKCIGDELERRAWQVLRFDTNLEKMIEGQKLSGMMLKDRGDMNPTEYISVQTDLAAQNFKVLLPEVTETVVTNEMMKLVASTLVQDAIFQARHNIHLQVQMAKYEEYDALSMDEDETQELLADLKPLESYLRYVASDEINRNKKATEKQYLHKENKKHMEFAIINLQNFIDSLDILDQDNMDRSFTDKVLYEIECHTLCENIKPLPHSVKGLAVFLMFCGTIFNLVYVGMTGGQLTTRQVQEWICCWLIGLGIHGLFLETVFAVIVGKMQERRQI